jgi:hypothetical protein
MLQQGPNRGHFMAAPSIVLYSSEDDGHIHMFFVAQTNVWLLIICSFIY